MSSNVVQRPPAAVDIIESEELVQYISPLFLTLDYKDRNVKAVIIGGTSVFFAATFAITLVICSLFPAFRNLPLKIRIFLSLSVVRGIFGVMTSVIGVYAIFKTTNLDRDLVFGTTATAHIGMLLTVGFFIFEFSAVVISDFAFKSFSKMLITHHALGVITYSVAINSSANFSFGCKVLLLEMSTPFSCLCYVLLKMGMERSIFWQVNQMVLIHTFHLRSVVECYLWYITVINWRYIWHFTPTSVLILTYLSLTLVTFVMTPYWGYKKTQQLFNPVDWNFEDSNMSRSKQSINVANGVTKKTE